MKLSIVNQLGHFIWILLSTVLNGSVYSNVVTFEEASKVFNRKSSSDSKPSFNSNGQCSMEMFKLNRQLRQVVHPLELEGHWVSTKCEVVPGPKFILRDYQFYKTGNFLLRQFEYSDEQCTKPSFGFTVDGDVIHLSKSWAVPGGSDVSFTVNRITVVPYTKDSAKSLTVSLRQSCTIEKSRPFDWPWLVEYKDYVLYYVEDETDQPVNDVVVGERLADIDCAHSANFSLSTLNLLRMDELGDDASSTPVEENFFTKRLYFGKSVWDSKNQTFLLPSSFTDALVDADQAQYCKTCERIKNSNPLSPPKLRSTVKDTDKVDISFYPAVEHVRGDWLSTECESFMHGMYGYRLMSFRGDDSRRWKLRQRYFNDPLCKHPSFTLLASGHFSPGPRVQSLALTQKLLYKIERVKLVAESKNFVRNIKLARNCGPSVNWRKGRTVDVTQYGGCRDLGIAVPSITRDIVKVTFDQNTRKTFLSMGDYSTVEYGGEEYPTAFHTPMVKCDQLSIKLSIEKTLDNNVNSNYLHLISNSSSSNSSRSKIFYCHIYVLILLCFIHTCIL